MIPSCILLYMIYNIAFSSTGMRYSLIGAETSTNETNSTRNDGTGSSTIIVTGTSLNGTDNSTIGTGTSLNGVDNSTIGTGTSLNGTGNTRNSIGTSLNGTGNSTVSTENILNGTSSSKDALNGSGSANGASQVISKRLLREIKPSKHQYTPLQQQYLSIKSSHPDAVLFIECGYKYKFFGEDAVTASKVLKIGCFTDHNLKTGSIPVYRLNVHLRRWVRVGASGCMCVCVCVCVCGYMYVCAGDVCAGVCWCVCRYVYACAGVCVCWCVCMCVLVGVCMCVLVGVCMCVLVGICMCVLVGVCMCVQVSMYVCAGRCMCMYLSLLAWNTINEEDKVFVLV